jgi:hypothetical protein
LKHWIKSHSRMNAHFGTATRSEIYSNLLFVSSTEVAKYLSCLKTLLWKNVKFYRIWISEFLSQIKHSVSKKYCRINRREKRLSHYTNPFFLQKDFRIKIEDIKEMRSQLIDCQCNNWNFKLNILKFWTICSLQL